MVTGTKKSAWTAGVLAFSGLFWLSTEEAAAQATDLVCSACVQATDLASNAVNNSKIGNGAVNAAKLAANAVTVAKIANNSITTAKITTAAVTAVKIGPNAVNTAKIANAAVTAAKIAGGAVNANKIADGAVSSAKIQNAAITGAKLADGAVTAAKLGLLDKTFVEALGPADSDNGDTLIAEMASITGPATVVLGPGTYDCQAQVVSLPAGVSLVGSGRETTAIVGGFITVSNQGLVDMGSGSELRNLSVANSASGANIVAIRLLADSHIGDVTATATGGNTVTAGIATFSDDCGTSTLTNFHAAATGVGGTVVGAGFNCTGGDLRGYDITAIATGGGANWGVADFNNGVKTFYSSSFEGASNSAMGDATLRIIGSELIGPVDPDIKCVGNFDGNGDALPSTTGCLAPP